MPLDFIFCYIMHWHLYILNGLSVGHCIGLNAPHAATDLLSIICYHKCLWFCTVVYRWCPLDLFTPGIIINTGEEEIPVMSSGLPVSLGSACSSQRPAQRIPHLWAISALRREPRGASPRVDTAGLYFHFPARIPAQVYWTHAFTGSYMALVIKSFKNVT